MSTVCGRAWLSLMGVEGEITECFPKGVVTGLGSAG